MARLRLFANLREAAGTTEVEFDGDSVGAVLEQARRRFGDVFARGLSTAKVWVNGEQADNDTPVSPGDEVALIPPVSGGATVVRSPVGFEVALVGALDLALIVATYGSLAWFAVAIVLTGGMWAFDLTDFAARRGIHMPAGPLFIAVMGGVLASYRWGTVGLAVATIGGVLVALGWALFEPGARPIAFIAPSALEAGLAAFGSGALMLLRLISRDATISFLVVGLLAIAAMWAIGQATIAGLDPQVGGLVGAFAGGLVAGLLWGDPLWHVLAAAVAAGVAAVAGRTIGALIRTGITQPAQLLGTFYPFDGFFPAAAGFWAVLTVL